MSRIDLIARFQIPQGRLEDLEPLAARCLAAVQEKDPGTLRYDWYLDETGTECVVVETYEDSDALLAHFQTVEEPLGEALEFTTVELELYGEPSPELREALAALGARFFSHLQGLG